MARTDETGSGNKSGRDWKRESSTKAGETGSGKVQRATTFVPYPMTQVFGDFKKFGLIQLHFEVSKNSFDLTIRDNQRLAYCVVDAQGIYQTSTYGGDIMTTRINLDKNYTYSHTFYTEEYLRSLIAKNRRKAETLVSRYTRWNQKFIAMSQSGKYSYDRLESFRDKLHYLKQDVIDWFAGEYPLYGWEEIQLPASHKKYQSDEEGKRAVIRNQHWRELLIDNRKCMENLIAQGEDPSEFCPMCHHFLTQEELDHEECACCQTHIESYWEEEY